MDEAFRLLELMITQKDQYDHLIIPNKVTKSIMVNKAGDDLQLIKKIYDWFDKNAESESTSE